MNFDGAQFESLALNFYENTALGEEARNTILTLSSDPTSILLFHEILHQTNSIEGRFLCLHIIGSNIQNGWPALLDHQRHLLKSDFFQLVFSWALLEVPSILLAQVNNVLIQILLVEWPSGWPSFLHDFIFASKNNPRVMRNGVNFLGMFSRNICQSSDLLSSRKSELTSALYDNFQMIYSFLKSTFNLTSNENDDITIKRNNEEIQIAALLSLSEYFSWIDLKSIATDKICEIILGQLMPNPNFRPAVLKLIIAVISRETVIASSSIIQLFQELIKTISSEISMLEDPELVPLFVEVLSKFVILDRCALMPNDTVTQWMIEYTKIVDDDLLSEIVSMWHSLTKVYIFDVQSLPFSSQFLVPLQFVLCSRMAKPPEFGGDREFYDECSETLNLLFKMHRAQALSIIVQKLDVEEFSFELMPWIFSIGALSGICHIEEERNLISTIFNILLRFYNQNQTHQDLQNSQQTDMQNVQNLLRQNIQNLQNIQNIQKVMSPSEISLNNMIVASFLFIAGQYTRYLAGNPQILELALVKIMESFISSCEENTIDDSNISNNNGMLLKFVAVHSFKKISIGCGQIMVENGFATRFFDQFSEFLIRTLPEFHVTFFEAITHVVKHCNNPAQKRLMTVALFEKANTVQILTELMPLVDESFRLPLENMMHSIFPRFLAQKDMSIQEKEEYYELFRRFLEMFPNTILLNDFIQMLMTDFTNVENISLTQNVSSAALALNVFATIVRSGNTEIIPMLYNNVIVPTFSVFLSHNFVDFPDMRYYFYVLIFAFFNHFTFLDTDAISNLLSFSFFGLKHPQPNISELSLNCITNVLSQLDKNEDMNYVNGFFNKFYIPMLEELLALLFDRLHSSLFSYITHAINHLLMIAASGKVNLYSSQQIMEIIYQKLRSILIESTTTTSSSLNSNYSSINYNNINNMNNVNDVNNMNINDVMINQNDVSNNSNVSGEKNLLFCNEEEIKMVAHEVVASQGNNGRLRQVLMDFVISSQQLQTPLVPPEEDLLELREIASAPIEIEFLKSIEDSQLVTTNDSDIAE